MKYLMSMGEDQRHRMIDKMVKIAAHTKKSNKQHVLQMHQEIVRRVKEKVSMKQKKRRGQIERKLRNIVKSGGDIGESFKDCPPEKVSVLLDIIHMNVLEMCIVHVWYDEDQQQDVEWKVCSSREKTHIQRSSSCSQLLGQGRDRTNFSAETPMSVYQLATDYYCDHLCFL